MIKKPVVSLLVAALVLSGCGPLTGGEPPASPMPHDGTDDTGYRPLGDANTVVNDLEAPWSVTFLEDAPLISERDSGRILEILPDGGSRTVGEQPEVMAGGECGLLGLTAGPNGDLYSYATTGNGNRVTRWTVTGERGSLILGESEVILDELPSAGVRNGGRIKFGPDDMLYVAVGDAGERGEAQDPNSMAGKILRLMPDGTVPDDNPHESSPVYSLGHRNVQGIDWAEDGTMFASEFGANTWDELNVIEPGANYGWPEVEGIAERDEFVDPVQQWETSEASPSGMSRVGDTLYIANLRGRVLRAVPVNSPDTSTDYFQDAYGRLRDAVPGPNGTLWLLTNNTDGRGQPQDGDDRLLEVDLP
ncbi:PQQ-dependent sugar dehydrogenase [Kocuria carniphila]|uniref:PQQ-dependent sugar dehydrogenase n=1 Tax=Kocuria carniphila TaxID=262208 RepID=UPI0034DB4CC8